MSDRKQGLIRELRDKEYRETYATQHVNAMLAAQISAIREERGLTQTELAKKIGKQQPAISRIENVNYARWNVQTLRELGTELGCWLDIRFKPWGAFVEYAADYSMETLRCAAIEDDPVFFGSEARGHVSEPIRWMQKKVLPWLQSEEDNTKLIAWLNGMDLPPVGDGDPPFVWISRAVAAEPVNSKYRALLSARVLRLLTSIEEGSAATNDRIPLLAGAFNLLAEFRSPSGWDKIRQLFYAAGKDLSETTVQKLLPEGARSAFLNALIHNQVGRELESVWLTMILKGSHSWLPANEFDGFEGVKWLSPRPRYDAIANALKEMYNARFIRPQLGIDFVDLMRDLKDTFENDSLFGEMLWYEGKRKEWESQIIRAWASVFASDPWSRKTLLQGAPVGEAAMLKAVLKATPISAEAGQESLDLVSLDQI